MTKILQKNYPIVLKISQKKFHAKKYQNIYAKAQIWKSKNIKIKTLLKPKNMYKKPRFLLSCLLGGNVENLPKQNLSQNITISEATSSFTKNHKLHPKVAKKVNNHPILSPFLRNLWSTSVLDTSGCRWFLNPRVSSVMHISVPKIFKVEKNENNNL